MMKIAHCFLWVFLLQTCTGLAGDTRPAAMHITGLAGIEDSLMLIRRYQQQEENVCMAGDGINDAPALRAAHAGTALGGIGSDTAADAADTALVGDDKKEIARLLNLSKRMMKTIIINLSVSMILNFAAAYEALCYVIICQYTITYKIGAYSLNI